MEQKIKGNSSPAFGRGILATSSLLPLLFTGIDRTLIFISFPN